MSAGMHWLESPLRWRVLVCFVSALLTASLSSCVYMTPQPRQPSPLDGITALAVTFDYGPMMVSGMGPPKPEAQWVAAKTAEDPAYPTTWADLKSRWENYFMQALTSSSPVPVSRAVAGQPVPDTTAGLNVQFTQLEIGKWAYVTTTDSSIDAMHVWSRSGQVVQQNPHQTRFHPSMTNNSIFRQIDELSKGQGQAAGGWLRRTISY